MLDSVAFLTRANCELLLHRKRAKAILNALPQPRLCAVRPLMNGDAHRWRTALVARFRVMLPHQPTGINFLLRLSAHDHVSNKEASYLWNASAQGALSGAYSHHSPAVPLFGVASVSVSPASFRWHLQPPNSLLNHILR